MLRSLSRSMKECSTHSASIPTPHAPKDRLIIALRSHSRAVPQRCEIVKRPPSACAFNTTFCPQRYIYYWPLWETYYCLYTTYCTQKQHTNKHHFLELFMGRLRSLLWTNASCGRYHFLVATTVYLRKEKAEAKVMDPEKTKRSFFLRVGFSSRVWLRGCPGIILCGE